MKRAVVVAVLLLAVSAWGSTARFTSPSTTNNDDSCDIAVQPAATLLLPFFEVDLKNPATTMLFTIQNLSPQPRIANVTLWTDWGFAALNFPIHLTGYDVEGVNLYDVIVNGTIPPTACGGASLSRFLAVDLQLIFTTGRTTGAGIPCTAQVGGVHPTAIGYVTIDLVATCAATNASSPGYFANLLYDNVLTGDYQQLATVNGKAHASGSPLVHLRAIPEGGPAAAFTGTSLPYTFYDRYVPIPGSDRRQPLPALFAPRFINGGTGSFNTTMKIWREAMTVGACSGAARASSNSNMDTIDRVRFDEHENATIVSVPCCFGPIPSPPGMPVTSIYSTANTTILPAFSTSGDVGGWFYLNLDNGVVNGRPSQAWVITTKFFEPTYATEAPAPSLGNGCSPKVKKDAQVGPAPNVTP